MSDNTGCDHDLNRVGKDVVCSKCGFTMLFPYVDDGTERYKIVDDGQDELAERYLNSILPDPLLDDEGIELFKQILDFARVNGILIDALADRREEIVRNGFLALFRKFQDDAFLLGKPVEFRDDLPDPGEIVFGAPDQVGDSFPVKLRASDIHISWHHVARISEMGAVRDGRPELELLGIDVGDQQGGELVTYVIDEIPQGAIKVQTSTPMFSFELTMLDWKDRALKAERRVKELEKQLIQARLQVMRSGRRGRR